MDLNRFFKFFKEDNNTDGELLNEDNIELYQEETPVFKIGMFIRLSEFKIIHSLKNINNVDNQSDVLFMLPGIDIDGNNKQEFDLVFNMLRYRHIKDLDLDNEMVVDSIKLWSEKNLEAYILDCLDY